MELEWMSPEQAAELWGVNKRQVQSLCSHGKIEGVVRLGRSWLIPKKAEKPVDGRTKTVKLKKKTDKI